jgi:hypothetical protein
MAEPLAVRQESELAGRFDLVLRCATHVSFNRY